ncbi:hypothetical protein OB920_13300 [Halobacteria archaeon HArc-gm2]|nr:hypothetical protein [Halobacteria archaeon HArc-gm2]
MLEQAKPTWRIDGENERKILNQIVNKNRIKWSQLSDYFGTVPSKLMSRVEAVNKKLMAGVEFANERDDLPREEMDEVEWQTYVLAAGYRGIMEDAFEERYSDIVEEYGEIYGDD